MTGRKNGFYLGFYNKILFGSWLECRVPRRISGPGPGPGPGPGAGPGPERRLSNGGRMRAW